jgi:hypothetical protein
MINIAPPKELPSPVRVERLLAQNRKPVVEGDPLILVSGMDGEFATILAQMDGTVFFPSTVFEGAQISHGETIIFMTPEDSEAESQPCRPEPQPPVQEARITRQAASSATAKTSPEESVIAMGGFLLIIAVAALCLFLTLAINALFRVAWPDLSLEELLLFSAASVGISAGITALSIKKMRKPATTGQVFSLLTAATFGFGLGLIPDDDIRFTTGYQPSDLAGFFTAGNPAKTAAAPRSTAIAEPARQAAPQRAVQTTPDTPPVQLHAWREGLQDEQQYIKYMENTVAIGAEVVKRDGPFDKVYHLDSGDHGMSLAIISMCDTRHNNKWTEIVAISNGHYETIRRYDDRCALPCLGCTDSDVILLDIFGTDSGGRPKINREFANAGGINRRQNHRGIQSPYCAFDWRRCN